MLITYLELPQKDGLAMLLYIPISKVHISDGIHWFIFISICIETILIAGELIYLPNNASLPITLMAREYEVFTIVPVKELWSGCGFAPIGLIKMFNSGGAVKELKYETERAGTGRISIKVRGSGAFGAYSSVRPKRIKVEEKETEFKYEDLCGLITLELSVPEEEMYLWNVTVEL